MISEYLRMKKHPSILRACRITTQKFLYFAVFLAALLRGTYFAAPVSRHGLLILFHNIRLFVTQIYPNGIFLQNAINVTC